MAPNGLETLVAKERRPLNTLSSELKIDCNLSTWSSGVSKWGPAGQNLHGRVDGPQWPSRPLQRRRPLFPSLISFSSLDDSVGLFAERLSAAVLAHLLRAQKPCLGHPACSNTARPAQRVTEKTRVKERRELNRVQPGNQTCTTLVIHPACSSTARPAQEKEKGKKERKKGDVLGFAAGFPLFQAQLCLLISQRTCIALRAELWRGIQAQVAVEADLLTLKSQPPTCLPYGLFISDFKKGSTPTLSRTKRRGAQPRPRWVRLDILPHSHVSQKSRADTAWTKTLEKPLPAILSATLSAFAGR